MHTSCYFLYKENIQEGADTKGETPALDTTMTRLTAKALMFLVLSPATDQLPSHTPLRRAAIDLIGKWIHYVLVAVSLDSRCTD